MSETKNITYKWDSPGDWLGDKINGADLEFVRGVARALIQAVDSDTIQDTFQREMDQDGYFTPQPPDGVEIVTINYKCRDIGYGVEEGEVEGYFTGAEDTWGKRTFQPLDRSDPLYLLADEILEVL